MLTWPLAIRGRIELRIAGSAFIVFAFAALSSPASPTRQLRLVQCLFDRFRSEFAFKYFLWLTIEDTLRLCYKMSWNRSISGPEMVHNLESEDTGAHGSFKQFIQVQLQSFQL